MSVAQLSGTVETAENGEIATEPLASWAYAPNVLALAGAMLPYHQAARAGSINGAAKSEEQDIARELLNSTPDGDAPCGEGSRRAAVLLRFGF